jgi:AraC-like DNA-binding protein
MIEKNIENKLKEQQEALVFQNFILCGELPAEETSDLKRLLTFCQGTFLHLIVFRQSLGVDQKLALELVKRGYEVKLFPRLHQGTLVLISSESGHLPDISGIIGDSRIQIAYSGACTTSHELCCANTQCERALLKRFFSLETLFKAETAGSDIEHIESLVSQWDTIFKHEAFDSINGLISEHLKQLKQIDSGWALEKYLRRSLQRMDSYILVQDVPLQKELWNHLAILHILDWFDTLDQFSCWFRELVGANIRHTIGKEDKDVVSIGERVKHIIDVSYADSSLDLQTIALKACGHPNYICTRFKEETGQGIAQYLKQVRLEHSKTLLKTMSCQETAWAVGFSDPYYFSKCFKQAYGICPNELLGNQP